MFYNHHLAAYEGLIVSRVLDVAWARAQVPAELRLASLVGSFFLTFICRHFNRIQRTQSLSMHMGEYFMMIMVY